MSRYGKVHRRMWGDEKFRRLTKPQPNAQSLWVYLLTSLNATACPGLMRVGRAQLAEELEWDLEGFDKAFAELSREGMAKADWKARVVWLPHAMEHNQPENPNVVKAWAKALDEIPECALKAQAIRGICAFLERFPEPFRKPFEQGLANQYQEQEQYQEQIPPKPPEGAGTPVEAKPKPDPEPETAEFQAWYQAYPRHEGRKDAWRAWRRAKDRPGLDVMLAALGWQKASEQWRKDGGQFVPMPATYLNQGRWADEPPQARGMPPPGRRVVTVPDGFPRAPSLDLEHPTR